MHRRVPGWLVLIASVYATTGVASAHEIGADRFTAPIPLTALYLGAGATVAVTAVWLGRRTTRIPETEHVLGTVTPATWRRLRLVGRMGFGLVFVAAIAHGLGGRQVAAENLATVFVWPVWLKGVALLAVLIGSPWRALSPWRAVHAAFEHLEGDRLALREYPSRFGVWPAVVGFVIVVGLLENLTVIPRSPLRTAGIISLYAAVALAGGFLLGRDWFRNGDFFEVLYAQFARVAPFSVTDGGEVALRYPWRECTRPAERPGLVTFLVAMVYTVSFDGLTSTPEYQSFHFAFVDSFGLSQSVAGGMLYFTGLVGFVVSFYLAMDAVAHVGGTAELPGEAAGAFAPTILPIAAAYEVAHNYPFVIRNLADLIELAATTVGLGAPSISLLGWLSVPAFWTSQVVLIVLGHLVAVVAAHGVAIDRYETLSRARRAHFPLVVIMVGYTVLSLWIISRPVVAA